MLNVLSVDVEDYFHVEAFASRVSPREWEGFECRVERNVDRVLELIGAHPVQATFFVLGWVARRFPRLVRDIVSAGHEIGCHGFGHQHLDRLTPESFREDIRTARQCLTDQVQKPIVAYRAPHFSITRRNLWALDVLADEGFEIDSSIFPIRHDLYGIPGAPRFLHRRGTILEFPPSTVRLFGNNIGVGGGGYLRILPYWWTRRALKRINASEGQPAMVYFHPWEIDPGQPRIKAGIKSTLRHYTNLDSMEGKLNRLLGEFRFGTLSEVCRQARLGARQDA